MSIIMSVIGRLHGDRVTMLDPGQTKYKHFRFLFCQIRDQCSSSSYSPLVFPIMYGRRYDCWSFFSASPCPLSANHFSSLVRTRLSISFSVVLSPFPWYIRSQHFPLYVFFISTHHIPVPVQSAVSILRNNMDASKRALLMNVLLIVTVSWSTACISMPPTRRLQLPCSKCTTYQRQTYSCYSSPITVARRRITLIPRARVPFG